MSQASPRLSLCAALISEKGLPSEALQNLPDGTCLQQIGGKGHTGILKTVRVIECPVKNLTFYVKPEPGKWYVRSIPKTQPKKRNVWEALPVAAVTLAVLCGIGAALGYSPGWPLLLVAILIGLLNLALLIARLVKRNK